MPKAEIRFSTVPGSIPTVSELDGYKFGYNKSDAILYGIQLSGGTQSVVPLTGSGSSHSRLHAINDPLDHAPVSAEYHDKILHTNATTGVIDFVSYRNDVRASGSTDSSVVTETGIRAAIDAAVSGVTSPWAVSGANIYNTNSGNVGIGTNSPGHALDVVGVIRASTAFRGAVNSSAYLIAHTNAAAQGIYFQTNSGGTTGLFVRHDGNVGVGTTNPLTKFHIGTLAGGNNEFRIDSANNAYLSFYSIGGEGRITAGGASTQSNILTFYTSNSGTEAEAMRITSAGKVGIGVTTPSSLLDVAGTVTAYTAKLTSVGTVAAAQLLGLDADKNLTTNVLPLVLSGIQPHNAGDGLFGSAYNGSAAVTWSVNFAGTGSASSVARSDHNHDGQYSAIGHNHYLASLADVLIDTLANGQVLRYNSTLDVWENGNADQYWKRTGTVLSPVSAGDSVLISVTGSSVAVQATSPSSIGVEGNSTTGYGLSGNSVSGIGTRGASTTSHGIYGQSSSGYGVLGSATSGIGVYGNSSTGVGGRFYSGSNIPLWIESNSSDTGSVYNMLNIMRYTTGTAVNGIGAMISFNVEEGNGTSVPSVQLIAQLSDVTAVSSDFSIRLRNAGSGTTEMLRLKGNGDLYTYADSYQTKENGAIKRLRGYHNYTGTPGYLKSGEYAGNLVFDAWSGASSYSSVAAISVLATSDHNSSNFASKMEFWLAEPSSLYPRQVAELTPEGKIKGIFGFSVFGADGISGTSTIITGVSYNSGTMVLTFTRSTLTVSGGIVTNVSAASDLTIPLSS